MEDLEYIKEILENKLDSFAVILKSELLHLKEEVEKLEGQLVTHACKDDEDTVELRASIVRIHGRIDSLEERIKLVEQPKKLKVGEIIKTKALEWAVPTGILFVFYLFVSGAVANFITSLVHVVK